MGLKKETLEKYYIKEGKSSREISSIFGCSENKINYWLNKYSIPKRTISEAIYQRANPVGDPFKICRIKSKDEAFLFGLGIGLYWGEGTKRNTHSVRLGNTDPDLIKKFIEFLVKLYGIEQKKIRFGLQVFSDMKPEVALRFWIKELGYSKSHFQKVVVTPARGVGNYRRKTKHGVLTIYFCNKKLRDIICGEIDVLRQM